MSMALVGCRRARAGILLRFLLLFLVSVISCSTGRAGETTCKPVKVDLLTGHAGAMMGEMHGTSEVPEFVARAVCKIASSHKSVVLALEYPRDDEPSLNAFLSNPDASSAQADLLKTQFWTRGRDGRASEAMLKLLLDLRSWKQNKLPITVVPYDKAPSAELREPSNAEFLSNLLKSQKDKAFVIIYSGEVHARKTKGLPGLDDFEPMGFLLRQWDLLHLDLAMTGGAAWICESASFDDCGPHPMKANVPLDLEPYAAALDSVSPAFDGHYGVGQVTASPPVVQPGYPPKSAPTR